MALQFTYFFGARPASVYPPAPPNRWRLPAPGSGRPGVLHGTFTYLLQDDDGQTADVHSVSAGLDYPGVGPEHSFWKDRKRVRYTSISDDEALDGFYQCSKLEG